MLCTYIYTYKYVFQKSTFEVSGKMNVLLAGSSFSRVEKGVSILPWKLNS